MIPFCSLEFDGLPSDIVTNHLKKATVSLVRSKQPDKLSIVLADPGGLLPQVRKGASATCEIGYLSPTGEKKSRIHGPFKVDGFGRGDQGQNEEFHINATSIDFRSKAKGRETRTHKNKSVPEILKAEGAAAGFEVIVSPEFEEFIYPSWPRTGQSFMQIVSEFAETFDAIEKYADNKLLFLSREGGFNAFGDPLSHRLTRNDLIKCWVEVNFRNSYGGVKATYRDHDTGEQKVEKAELDPNDPWYEHRKLFPNKKIAKAAASAKAKQLKRDEKTLNFQTKIGDPDLIENVDLTIADWNADTNGLWVTDTVTHTYDAENDGYMTEGTGKTKA